MVDQRLFGLKEVADNGGLDEKDGSLGKIAADNQAGDEGSDGVVDYGNIDSDYEEDSCFAGRVENESGDDWAS